MNATTNVAEKASKTERIFLNPGDKGVYYLISKTVYSGKNDDLNFMSWKNNQLVFVDVVLNEVVKTLSQHFSRTIVVETGTVDSCRITSTYTDQSIEDIIEEIEILLNTNRLPARICFVGDTFNPCGLLRLSISGA